MQKARQPKPAGQVRELICQETVHIQRPPNTIVPFLKRKSPATFRQRAGCTLMAKVETDPNPGEGLL
jgi:hypothetical protein